MKLYAYNCYTTLAANSTRITPLIAAFNVPDERVCLISSPLLLKPVIIDAMSGEMMTSHINRPFVNQFNSSH